MTDPPVYAIPPTPCRWPWRRALAFILSVLILGALLYHYGH